MRTTRRTGFPATVEALADAIRAADGVIIVTPEYNYGVPGGLKNAIDWVSRMKDQPFKDKPVAIQSVTGGPLGGGRVQYHLRQTWCSSRRSPSPGRKSSSAWRRSKFDEKTLEFKDEAGHQLHQAAACRVREVHPQDEREVAGIVARPAKARCACCDAP